MKRLIRTSRHYFQSFANTGKRSELARFLSAAREALDIYIDFLWDSKIEYKIKDKEIVFDRKNDLLECPSFISTKQVSFDTELSARALKCISTQACGIVKGILTEKKNLENRIEWLESHGLSSERNKKKLEEISFSKPFVSRKIPLEFNSINLSIIDQENCFFDGFLKCFSLGESFDEIYLPLKWTKVSNKYKNFANAKRLNSFLISENFVEIRWEVSVPPRTEGSVLGVDTGKNVIAYLSDGQRTNPCPHGHDLSSISEKMSRKKKGSNAFERAQRHRTNYINWSINQLNFEGVKELRIEAIRNLRDGKTVSRKMSHFTYTASEKKLISLAEILGVQVSLQPSFYKSQRCFCCGFVLEENRKEEKFECLFCGHSSHADLNAAQNNSIDLPNTYSLRRILSELKNSDGFFWNTKGFSDREGQELTVPAAKKSNI